MKYNNVIEYKSKPMIIAICGKSATGKDTLAKWLVSSLKLQGYPAQAIVSDTTRPSRKNETNGSDYNFLTKDAFYDKINSSEYLEYTSFNGWLYGISKDSISSTKINVGVFNPEGLEHLILYKKDYDIFCIYLECNVFKRLKRSYEREHAFKKEYLRRVYADYHSFKDIEKILILSNNYGVIDTSNRSIQQTLDDMLFLLEYMNYINYSEDDKNFKIIFKYNKA